MRLTNRLTFFASAVVLSLGLVACGGTVAPGGAGNGPPGGGGHGHTGGGGNGLVAVAVPGGHAYWFGPGDGGAPPGVDGGAGASSPDTTGLYLVIGGPEVPTCTKPVPSPVSDPNFPGNQVDFSIDVPQDSQKPGTLSLGVQRLAGAQLLLLCSGPSCGTAYPGTLDITSIDSASVGFTIAGTQQTDGLPSIDGTYTAARCP